MTTREASASGCARYKLKCDLGPKNKGFRNLVSHDAEAGRGDDGLRLLDESRVCLERAARQARSRGGSIAEVTAELRSSLREIL